MIPPREKDTSTTSTTAATSSTSAPTATGAELPAGAGAGRDPRPRALEGGHPRIATTSCSRTSTSSPTTTSSTSARTACPPARHRACATAASITSSFPEPTYDVVRGGRTPSSTRASYRFRYQSLVTPPSVFDYDVTTRGSSTLLKQTEVLGRLRPHALPHRAAARHRGGRHARPDLARLRATDAPRDGTSPLLPRTATAPTAFRYPALFSSNRLSLLDRGVSVAIAHIRGGGELGKRWHDAGPHAEQAQHVHRLHRRAPSTWSPRATPRPTGWPSRAAARAAS